MNEDVFKTTLIYGSFFALQYLIYGIIITVIGKKLLLGKLLYVTLSTIAKFKY